MNKARRKIIKNSCEKLKIIKDDLDDVLSDEEMALESLEEHFPGTERVDNMQEIVDNLTDVIDDLDDLIDRLSDIE